MSSAVGSCPERSSSRNSFDFTSCMVCWVLQGEVYPRAVLNHSGRGGGFAGRSSPGTLLLRCPSLPAWLEARLGGPEQLDVAAVVACVSANRQSAQGIRAVEVADRGSSLPGRPHIRQRKATVWLRFLVDLVRVDFLVRA